MKKPVYKCLIGTIMARANCEKKGNTLWFERHDDRIDEIKNDYLPHGSGIDSGCQIDPDNCKPNRIVITSSYHVMDEGGYVGWIDFTVTVTPSLYNDIDLKITGPFSQRWIPDGEGLKDYLYEIFDAHLREEIEEYSA